MLIAVVLGAVVVTAAVCLGRARFLLVTVAGDSMEPTLMTGDRLLMRRAGLAAVRRGELVVVAVRDHRGATDRTSGRGPVAELMVKRAAALPGDRVPAGIPVPGCLVPPGRLVVLGDNPEHSYDSRASGYLPSGDVVGVIVYALAGRARRSTASMRRSRRWPDPPPGGRSRLHRLLPPGAGG